MKAVLTFLMLGALAAAQTPPPDAFFDSAGVRIRYVEQGEGTPVVLIHGYTGTLERHWINNGVFADLARDHRVIAFDARGHGKSAKPHDPKLYGAEMGRDIVRLLDHLKIPRAHIVGYSMGAIIAGQLLTTHPDRFITATFVAHHAVYRWTPEYERDVETSVKDLSGDIPFKALVVALNPPGTPLPSDDEIRKRVQPLIAANDVKALEAYYRAWRTMVVTPEAIAAVRVPTLGIIGSADPSAETMRELDTMMPSLDVVIVEGAEHGGERGVLRHKDFLPTLREFLSRPR